MYTKQFLQVIFDLMRPYQIYFPLLTASEKLAIIKSHLVPNPKSMGTRSPHLCVSNDVWDLFIGIF